MLAAFVVGLATNPIVAAANCRWAVVPSPNANGNGNYLLDISSVPKSGTWASGDYYGSGNIYYTLIEHWNGQVWTIVPSPNGSNIGNLLFGISSVSKSDAWTAGHYIGTDNISRTLIEHWNGHVWKIVPSPNAGTLDNYLDDVFAISTSDVWAAGYYFGSDNIVHTLTEHWDGQVWSIIPSPNANNNANDLVRLSAISTSDVWAVGSYTGNDNILHTLIEQWDGQAWKVIPSPNANNNGNQLSDVSFVSASDAWASGYYTGNDNIDHTLLEHWDGQLWMVISSPNANNNGNFLNAISMITQSNVWATGYYRGNDNIDHTLVEHWNGRVWAITSSPNANNNGNYLEGVSGVSKIDSWAAGIYYGNDNVYHTLVEHCT